MGVDGTDVQQERPLLAFAKLCSKVFKENAIALLVIIMLALSLRNSILWLATWVSDYSPFVAGLLIPLAPIAMMSGVIIALWRMRPSLPYLATLPTQPTGRVRTHLLTIGGLLIPFLAVYASNGLLKEDVRRFIYDASVHETITSFAQRDYSRVLLGSTWYVIALVVVTVSARKILSYFFPSTTSLALTGFSAYLEVLWIGTVSVIIAAQTTQLRNWTSTRAVIAPALDNWKQLTGHFDTVQSQWTQLGTFLGRFDDIIIVPVAWLTLGAVIYGTTLTPKPSTTASKDSDTAEAAAIAAAMKERATSEARRVYTNATKPVFGPISTTWAALKKISVAGAIPMVSFCVLFLLSKGMETATVFAGRALIGPHSGLEGLGLQPYLLTAGRIVYFFVALPLLVTALDTLLRAQAQRTAA